MNDGIIDCKAESEDEGGDGEPPLALAEDEIDETWRFVAANGLDTLRLERGVCVGAGRRIQRSPVPLVGLVLVLVEELHLVGFTSGSGFVGS